MLHRRNNESGMVLVLGLLLTIIIMVYAIGVLSRGTSQVVSAEDQVDRIKTEQLAIGAYAKTYSEMASGAPAPSTFSETLDGKTYSISVSSTSATGPINSDTLTFNSSVSN